MTPDRAIPKGRLLYLIPRELSQTVSTALTFHLGYFENGPLEPTYH